jgi:AraC-like DNA-binding protein
VNSLKLEIEEELDSHSPQRAGLINGVSAADVGDPVKALYKVLAGMPYYGFSHNGIAKMLEVGRSIFGSEYGLLLHSLSPQVAEVMGAAGGDERFFVGQHLAVEGTSIARAFDRQEPVLGQSFSLVSVCSPELSYNGVQVNSYLGTVVVPSSVDPMVVCFFSTQGHTESYTAEDTETIELLAEGVACMIDLQKAQVQRKMTDQAVFALGSVKTLEEYRQQAEIPEVYGVSARVVEVLQRRVGNSPLSIGHIAEELNLSKRTLQRRLQQQGVSFAELRDQLRFHHSIDFLVKQHTSIDSISASLDFSDRTSFTNAFKRWTGLSPSTFRKLFRDYA